MIRLITNFLIIIVLTLLNVPNASAKDDISDVLERLDVSLSHKKDYEKIKIDRIRKLNDLLSETSDQDVKYSTLVSLYEEYKSYRYDSASVYAHRCLELAMELKNPEYILDSKCYIAFSLVSAGISMEARDILSSIDVSSLSRESLRNYYFTCNKLWQEEADRVHDAVLYDRYITKGNAYMDSLCAILTPRAADYWRFHGSKLMRLSRHKEALHSFQKYLSFKGITAHEKAMVYAEIAWAYIWLGDEDKSIVNFALSAIYDNESATREITALYLLAERIRNRGESDRAITYIHMALDDINFYNANQRKLELGAILPQIEQERYDIIRAQWKTMLIATALAVLFIIAVGVSYVLIRKKNRLLMIAEQQERLNLLALEKANTQLVEANKIKTEYIGQSFYANAEAMTKMDKLCKSIERQLATRQYDKIKDTVNGERLEAERTNMYATFDSTFLGLFPNFVEEYNKLFEERNRKYPENENSLTPEMRIFALIRLGITGSEKIGNFLNYSVHTVNTYKTRIKNSSIVDNDKFEQIIRNI